MKYKERQISVEDMKKLQLNILQNIAEFCEKNKIEYYLFAGTLIGAVRHRGYIPWDDDLDICMKREDYNRFFRLYNSSKNPRYRAICLENNQEYYLASGKVIDMRTIMKENVSSNLEIGVYIDIFPLDYIPTDEKLYNKMNNKLDRYRKMLIIKNLTRRKGRSIAKNFALIVAKTILIPIPRKVILNNIAREAQRYLNQHDESFALADISVYTYGKRELFSQKDFSGCEWFYFENVKYPVPIGFDHILSSMYGDYMKLPPIEKQISHHDYIAYWRRNETL